jgi:hypothetical protein
MKYEKTKEIEIALSTYFKTRVNIIVPCVSWGIDIHECDMIILSKHGYATEVEIKISMSDLKKDKNKYHGHNDDRIKQLFFAIPKKLFNEKIYEHIPERAGLLIVYSSGRVVLHRDCIINNFARKWTDDEKIKLMHLCTMRYWKLREKLLQITSKQQKV